MSMKTSLTVLVTLCFLCSLPALLPAGTVIFGTGGEPVSVAENGQAQPTPFLPPNLLQSTLIDSWDAPSEYNWALNADFAWANVWDTNDISEPYELTEIQYYASPTLGVQFDFYMTTDNGGWPDDANMTLLASRNDLDGHGVFDWVSIDVSAAGYVVQPGQIYWFVQVCPIGGWPGFTWASATNYSPPVNPPVKITQSFPSGGWGNWVNDWWMLFRIYGDPEGLALSVDQLVGGETSTVSVSGAVPYDTVIIGYSITGGGPINSPWGPVYLSHPIKQLPWQTADAFGNVTFSATCPNFPGVHVWLQALDLQAGVLSNGWDGVIQ
jgi:hypothetical protein